MPTASDGKSISNASATTLGFPLGGGRYNVAVVATFGGGSVTFQALGPDATTWLNVVAAFTVAGFATVDIGPGQYRFAITTATAVYASVYRVPS